VFCQRSGYPAASHGVMRPQRAIHPLKSNKTPPEGTRLPTGWPKKRALEWRKSAEDDLLTESGAETRRPCAALRAQHVDLLTRSTRSRKFFVQSAAAANR
jgi:hypothetical protein